MNDPVLQRSLEKLIAAKREELMARVANGELQAVWFDVASTISAYVYIGKVLQEKDKKQGDMFLRRLHDFVRTAIGGVESFDA